MSLEPESVTRLIRLLRLEPHPEGGYFRRTLTSEENCQTAAGERPLMSSIFYLLTASQATGHCHRNRSGILHCWQGGGALRYTTISPAGALEQFILGPDIEHGHKLQHWVAGGYWKASQLLNGDYALISEAVSLGFDYADQEMATPSLLQEYPQYSERISNLIAAPD